MNYRSPLIITLLFLSLTVRSMAMGALPCVHDNAGPSEGTAMHCMQMEPGAIQDPRHCPAEHGEQDCTSCVVCHLASVYSVPEAVMPVEIISLDNAYPPLAPSRIPHSIPDSPLRPPQTC